MASSESKYEVVEYPCHKCNFTSSYQHNLLNHFKLKHLPPTFHCYHCEYKTWDRGDLLAHSKSEHKKRYSCNICDYHTKSERDLIRHKEIKHIDHKIDFIAAEKQTISKLPLQVKLDQFIVRDIEPEQFPCAQCDYKATRRHTLLEHIESKHKGVKFSCKQCDFKASWKPSLLRHIKSFHEGVKFPCDQCEHKASQKGSLRKHIKTIHKG